MEEGLFKNNFQASDTFGRNQQSIAQRDKGVLNIQTQCIAEAEYSDFFSPSLFGFDKDLNKQHLK